mgnify:CR=1 FL=1
MIKGEYMEKGIEREKWIDYTKLFACILVVIGHLLQGLNKANIHGILAYIILLIILYIFSICLYLCV